MFHPFLCLKRRQIHLIPFLFLVVGLSLCSGLAAEQKPALILREGTPLTMIALPEYVPHSIPLSPGIRRRLEGARSTEFHIYYNPLFGCSGVLSAWPAEAKTAFEYAANVWGSVLNSGVPISIMACWQADLGSGILGQGGPVLIGNYDGAPFSNTYYPLALANAISGKALNAQVNMVLSFNSNTDWYYGTDGAVPSGQYDFTTVVLHELGHGLGFFGRIGYRDGIGYLPDYPSAFDRFACNGDTPLLSYPGNTVALGSALTGGNLFFDGPHARAANLGIAVPLYAPGTWLDGSSYSHLDYTTFRQTANALMVYAMGRGQALHDPGPVTLGIFQDIGWNVSYTPYTTTTVVSSTSSTTDTTTSTSTSSTSSTSSTTTSSSSSSTTTTLYANACVAGSPAILCLNDRRFRVETMWRTPDNTTGVGQAVPLSDGSDNAANSGYFWFFSPDNVELTVKILDGRAINGHFWVFFGTMTDVEFWIIITDTQTGRIKQYYNPMYSMSNARDTAAF